jgi:hypothetical protein
LGDNSLIIYRLGEKLPFGGFPKKLRKIPIIKEDSKKSEDWRVWVIPSYRQPYQHTDIPAYRDTGSHTGIPP